MERQTDFLRGRSRCRDGLGIPETPQVCHDLSHHLRVKVPKLKAEKGLRDFVPSYRSITTRPTPASRTHHFDNKSNPVSSHKVVLGLAVASRTLGILVICDSFEFRKSRPQSTSSHAIVVSAAPLQTSRESDTAPEKDCILNISLKQGYRSHI